MINYGLIQDQRVQQAGASVFLSKWKKRFDGVSPSAKELSDFLIDINMANDSDQAEVTIKEMRESTTKYGNFLAWEKRFQLVRDPSSDHYKLRSWLTVSADTPM